LAPVFDLSVPPRNEWMETIAANGAPSLRLPLGEARIHDGSSAERGDRRDRAA